MRITTTLPALILGAALLAALPAPALAADDARAATLAESARARAQQGERRVAIDLYEEAFAASPHREYLKEIGDLYDALAQGGDSRDVRLAILYYERFLADEGQTPARAAVEPRLDRLRTWKSKMRSEPQPPPPPQTVPLHLLAYDAANEYQTSLGCRTPCTVLVPPGPMKLEATGSGKVATQIVVPPHAGQVRLQHTDSAGYVTGAVLLPVGIVSGASMWALLFACGEDSTGCQLANVTIWPILGAGAMITGIVLLARGRILPAADANRVELVAGGKAPVQLSSFGLGPVAGGGKAASVGFTF